MRIVIDLQGAQSTGSRNRGIGRYSLSLAQAIIRNKGEHDVIIALNGLFGDTIEPIRAALDNLISQDKIRVWNALGPVKHIQSENNWRRKVAEHTRESFLASLKPDFVYLTSLFEGLVDDAVTSVGLFTQSIPTAVTLYDLIPLINRKPYLENPQVEAWYENKLDHLRRADLLLAISESSRQEGINYLAFPVEQAVNVGTAADSQFKLTAISTSTEQSVRARYGLSRTFLMYTGGIDHRKNIERLIRAFALLPRALRVEHQLAIVCSVHAESKERLLALAKQQGLGADEVVLTGFVPEEDLIALYHMCNAFIFPSWHEGFGLPALEAMACGAPVIAASTSSLPEVVGNDDALFDPYSEKAIATKIKQVLTDDLFRAQLREHGLEQAKKFSWDVSAKQAIAAFERYHNDRKQLKRSALLPSHRPRLAYISPLPPERSGIADYSAELLPELARHYQIEVIVAQEVVTDPWIKENCPIRSVEWFLANSDQFERTLYHFGNSHFHQHMFDLLERVPGVVVLHDFFLGHITTHMDGQKKQDSPDFLAKVLYKSHGYRAVEERYHAKNIWDIAWKYPCNKSVLESATGVIVHSESSLRLADEWLGHTFSNDWSVIPLLRAKAVALRRAEARKILGIGEQEFVVCSFGMLGPNKQNHRLLDAWLASPLSLDRSCQLVFVGENPEGTYGDQLKVRIRKSGLSDRIHITGWLDASQFKQYLAAADIGVQLRTMSRGETSAAVLDCMNYGLPTIVNANGSMADLPNDAVWMMPDEFTDEELAKALETLWKHAGERNALREHALHVISTRHSPRACADQYANSIERFVERARSNQMGLIHAIADIDGFENNKSALLALAQCIAGNQPPTSIKQILLDISILVQCDAKSGIQRVVRSILIEFLTNPPKGYRVEPVYAVLNQPGYRYARQFTSRFLDCPTHILSDEPVDALSGDIFVGLDLVPFAYQQTDFFAKLRTVGAQTHFVLYDLLPIYMPDSFPDEVPIAHARWLRELAKADGIVCISRAVADEMQAWLDVFGPERLRPLRLGWFHLGADVAGSIPTKGMRKDSESVLHALSKRKTFLVVGTIEPRKGQKQTLAATEKLWSQGVDINLVLLGKQGWNVDDFIQSLRSHAELNRRLFWLEGVSDEYLEAVYAATSCLIASSEGEGFGLPLIEAAKHKLPIIARDLPVFREVAGENAYYFSGNTADALADCMRNWLALNQANQAPSSESMPWLTWNQSAQRLQDVLLGGMWYKQWMPDSGHRYWGGDERLSTQVGRRSGQGISSTGQAGCLLFGPYLPLSSGQYQILIRGHGGDSGLENVRMDVAVEGGARILAESALQLPDDDGNLAMVQLTLQKPCTDLEVRVWVETVSEVTITLLEIKPSQNA